MKVATGFLLFLTTYSPACLESLMVAIIYIHRSVLEFIDQQIEKEGQGARRERGKIEYLLLGQDVTCSALKQMALGTGCSWF